MNLLSIVLYLLSLILCLVLGVVVGFMWGMEFTVRAQGKDEVNRERH